MINKKKAKKSLDRKYPLRTIALQQQQLFQKSEIVFPLQKVRLTVSHSNLGSYSFELGLRRGFCCGLPLSFAVGASAYMTKQKDERKKNVKINLQTQDGGVVAPRCIVAHRLRSTVPRESLVTLERCRAVVFVKCDGAILGCRQMTAS